MSCGNIFFFSDHHHYQHNGAHTHTCRPVLFSFSKKKNNYYSRFLFVSFEIDFILDFHVFPHNNEKKKKRSKCVFVIWIWKLNYHTHIQIDSRYSRMKEKTTFFPLHHRHHQCFFHRNCFNKIVRLCENYKSEKNLEMYSFYTKNSRTQIISTIQWFQNTDDEWEMLFANTQSVAQEKINFKKKFSYLIKWTKNRLCR